MKVDHILVSLADHTGFPITVEIRYGERCDSTGDILPGRPRRAGPEGAVTVAELQSPIRTNQIRLSVSVEIGGDRLAVPRISWMLEKQTLRSGANRQSQERNCSDQETSVRSWNLDHMARGRDHRRHDAETRTTADANPRLIASVAILEYPKGGAVRDL